VGREVYTPRAAAALGRYAAHLRDARARAREEIGGLEEELGRYGVVVDRDRDGDSDGTRGRERGNEAKERTMREMARVYRDMERQIEEVRADLERLGRA
jgi:hypothetical protein